MYNVHTAGRRAGFRSSLLTATSACALLVTSASLAQAADETADEDQIVFEEIIVLGEKRGRSVQDTISSLSVTTGLEIEKSTIENVYDVLKRTAGVSSAGGDLSFSIRGINSEGQNGSGSSLASIYVDGAILSTEAAGKGGPLSMWDVAQVEVFRGSQATSQGRNALAGAIVIRTEDPSYEWTGKAKASYGNLESYRTSAAFGGPIVDNQLAFRVSVDKIHTDGKAENVTLGLDDWAVEDSFVARGKLLWEPEGIDNLSVKLTGFYSETEFGTEEVNLFEDVAQTQPVDPYDRLAFSNIRDLTETETKNLIFEVNYDNVLDGIDLVAITAYSDLTQLQTFDQDFTAIGLPDGSTVNVDSDNFSQELRLSYDRGGPFTGLFGFYYFESDDTNDLRNNIATDLAPFLPLFPESVRPLVPAEFIVNVSVIEETKVENYAFFFEGDYQVSDSWQVTAGLRYDREKQILGNINTYVPDPEFPDFLLPALLPFVPDDVDEQGDNTYEAWLPSVAITHSFNDDLSASLSAKRAYRAGGTDFNLARSTIVQYDPEYAWTYELALRSQWLDRALTANANIYYMDWTDQQVEVQLSDVSRFDTQTENAGKSHLYGAELELSASPSDVLDVFVSASYSKTEFDEFVSNGTDLAGNEFRFAPKWQLVVGGSYDNGGWVADFDAAYTSASFDNAQNRIEQDRLGSRFIVNAKVGYEAEKYGIYLYGRNILDEKYLRNNGGIVALVGDPAMYGIQLKLGF